MSDNFVEILQRESDDHRLVVFHHPDGGLWMLVEVVPGEGVWRILWMRGGEGREEVAPLSEERIRELARRSLTMEELDRTPSCPVCLEDFQPEEEVFLSGCSNSHPGHIPCLSRWMRVRVSALSVGRSRGS